jgi:DNA (cytosine-5)-methyltransferase 1
VPQSRPRIFIVSAHGVPSDVVKRLAMNAEADLLREIPRRKTTLIDVLEDHPPVDGFTLAEVKRHLAMMSPEQAKRMEAAKAEGRTVAAPFARRMRGQKSGERVQGVEARWDGLAGALRVASGGGSSKQFIMIIRGPDVRMRTISPREAARLMGLPDSYRLPAKAADALDLCGDGVVVPVVRFLAERVIELLLEPVTRDAALRAAGGG